MKYYLAIVLAQIAIAFAGRLPLPESLQDKWHFVMKDDEVDLGRVVGGDPCKDGERPYQIGLFRSGSFSCGGSLITKKTVLTAAHCVDGSESNPSIFTVRHGHLEREKGEVVQVSRVIKHANYNSRTIDYDYALLILAKEFTPGANAAVATLCEKTDDPKATDKVVVSGWGRTTGGGSLANGLLKADLACVSRADCGSKWGTTNAITARMICAHSTTKSACNGDSGGPLTSSNGKLCGVVSWGSSSCLHQTLPNVYASVPDARDWIDANKVN